VVREEIDVLGELPLRGDGEVDLMRVETGCLFMGLAEVVDVVAEALDLTVVIDLLLNEVRAEGEEEEELIVLLVVGVLSSTSDGDEDLRRGGRVK